MRLRVLGLFAAAPLLLAHCQPGCGPVPRDPAATTTTTTIAGSSPTTSPSSTTTSTLPLTRPPVAVSRTVDMVGWQIDGNLLADDDPGVPRSTVTRLSLGFGAQYFPPLNTWFGLFDAATEAYCGMMIVAPNGDYAFDATPESGAKTCWVEYTLTNSAGSSTGRETIVLDPEVRVP